FRETDLADYNTNNLKANLGFYYKLTDSVEVSYNINYSTGTTVYQGDNRYSLKGIQFLQNKVQIGKEGKWFVRAYATHEDAGQSYDLVTTGIRLGEATKDSDDWFTRYRATWRSRDYAVKLRQFDGYPNTSDFESDELWAEAFDQLVVQYKDKIAAWKQEIQTNLEDDTRAGQPNYVPGTPQYDSAFTDITSRKFTENGSLFFDRSALYHVQGEYQFKIDKFKFVVGANGRLYTPNSQGTIFQDTLTFKRELIDSVMTITDSSYATVRNMEFGAYMGVSRSFIKNKLQTNFTLRVDKNQNFNFLLSPALSAVYSPNINHTFRSTFSSAIRNPTLADQYLYYNVGRAILLGNLNGYDSLLTVPSIIDYLAELDAGKLDYFSVDPIRPERVRTIEGGYRGIFKEKVYVDITAYKSWYTDFIGYLIGVESGFDNLLGLPINPQVYRVAANATSTVKTQGVTIGFNYFYAKKHALNGNYSYNELTSGEDDPIIPAFNTPKNKFNIGISGRDIITPFLSFGRWGYSINYRWVQGFTFEGSPQFTGEIDSYGMLNAQVNYSVSKWHSTVKIGASNVLDNRVYQVYGGPQIGRLAYISLVFDWNKT
ncbi:MAG: TonB-dependent receptor, partial [Salibacteraceae bacterium]|nr:TonB-dependent receptor [Salibacteraceae bacterium]